MSPSTAPRVAIDAAELAVAEAALQALHGGGSDGIAPGQVLMDELDWSCASFQLSLTDLAATLRKNAGKDVRLAEAVQDFVEKSQDGCRTELLVSHIDGLELIPEERLASLSDEGRFWTEFNETFPKSLGYGRLSRVGLSSDRSLAIVATSWSGGWLMGAGEIKVFELVDRKWTRSDKDLKVRWVS